MSFAGKDITAQGCHTAAVTGVRSGSTEVKPDVQQPEAEEAPSNRKASQQHKCIVIIDSDEESLDAVGQARSSSSDDGNEIFSARGDPEEQLRSVSSDVAAMLPVQPTGQLISSCEQCVVCRERAFVNDLKQCASCDKLLHEECAASLPMPLSLYCFFCKDCEKQPHQRGALLEALAAKGKQGGTVKELRVLVAQREAACMEANTDNTITRLIGAGRTIQAELNQMVRSHDSHQDVGFQIEICFEHRIVSRQRYRLKLGSEDEWDCIESESQQAPVTNGDNIQEDPAIQQSDAFGRPETNSSLRAQIRRPAQAAAAEDKAAAMPASSPTFLQNLNNRPQAHLPQSGKRKGSPGRQSQSAAKRNMQNRTSARRLQDMEAEMHKLKQDNLRLREQLKGQHRQVARLDPFRVGNQQSSSTQKNVCSTADTVGIADDASAQQLFGIVEQVLQSLQKCKPAELSAIPSLPDLKAQRMEQLLKSLEPQLRGDDISEWMDAVRQFEKPVQELIVTQSNLDLGLEEVEVSKRSCTSNLQSLVTQLGEVLNSWQNWLISIAKYETKAKDVMQLQHRQHLCAAVRSASK